MKKQQKYHCSINFKRFLIIKFYISLMENLSKSSSMFHPRSSLPLQRNPTLVSTKKLQNINCIVSSPEGSLFLGDIISTLKVQLLQQHNITAVLSSIGDEKALKHFSCPQISKQVAHHKIIPAQDVPNYPLIKHFNEAFQFIEDKLNQGCNVLVHCHAGLSRSATVVCAYLMRKNKWDAEKAIDYVKSKRNRIRPNEGFMKMLKDYERECDKNQANRKFNDNLNRKASIESKTASSKNSINLRNMQANQFANQNIQHHRRIPYNNLMIQQQNMDRSFHQHYLSSSNKFSNQPLHNRNPEISQNTQIRFNQGTPQKNGQFLVNRSFSYSSRHDPQRSLILQDKNRDQQMFALPETLKLTKKAISDFNRHSDPKKKFGTTFKNRILSKAQSDLISWSRPHPHMQPHYN